MGPENFMPPTSVPAAADSRRQTIRKPRAVCGCLGWGLLPPGLTPTRLMILCFAPGIEERRKPKTKKRHANLQTPLSRPSHEAPKFGWNLGRWHAIGQFNP